MRRLGRGLAIAAGSLMVAAAPAGTVFGHAELRESVPAAGAHLADPPPLISLRFSERVELLDDAVVLLDADGTRIDLGDPTADGSVVMATVPDLPEGAYVVDWQVVSADGHPVAGAFTFTVGNATPIDPSTVAPPSGTSTSGSAGLIVWRALTYAGFALVLGTWAFVLTCWGDGRRDRVVALVATGGAVLALVATVLRALTEASVLDASLADTFDLRSGRAWIALIVLAALALGVAPLLRRRLGRPALVGIWIASAIAVGVAIAYAGHGSGGRVAFGGTVVTVLHVAAASVWIGGLAALMRCLVAVDRPTAWGVATRFSNIAIVLVAVLAATGALQAFRQLDSWDALTGSDYGQALLVKLGIIVGLLIAARLSRLTVNRSSDVPTYLMPGMAMSDLVNIPFAGQWTLTINARYGDFEALTFELPFTIS